jgi:hypothetical protein
MRSLTTLMLLCLAAPALAAQQRAEPLQRAIPALEAPVLGAERADPALPGTASSIGEADSDEQRIHDASASSQALLDQAFLRQILAGVIVTVLSTLILRAIL